MHPPDIEPATKPSSRIANIAPGGRGDEPHVCTIVPSITSCPDALQSRLVFITCKSTKYPISAYDKNGDVINVKVANQSKADVLIKPYGWTSPTGAKGTSAGIAKLVVTDLIEYRDDAIDSIEESSVEVL